MACRWRFEVQDNGKGFDVATVPPDSLHVGLGIMRERAHRVGAVLQVESTPGQGTRVCIELPTVTAATTMPPQPAPPSAAAIAPQGAASGEELTPAVAAGRVATTA